MEGMHVKGIAANELNTKLWPLLQDHYFVLDADAADHTITLYDIRSEEVDFFGAGYPCQPWSSNGNLEMEADVRHEVARNLFWVCTIVNHW